MSQRTVHGPKITPDRLPVECPNCEQTILCDSAQTIDAAVATHDTHCPGRPVHVKNRPRRIECPDCGRHLATIGSGGAGDYDLQVERVHALHTCPPNTPKRRTGRPVMTAPIPTPTPPGESACPPAQQLLTHPSKRVARQAAKVLAEQSKLADAWKADAGNAKIRAEIAEHEARIRALKQKLQQPGPKPKAAS